MVALFLRRNVDGTCGLLPRFAVDVHGNFPVDDDAHLASLTNANRFVDANVQLTEV
jgi:hypothetical protein